MTPNALPTHWHLRTRRLDLPHPGGSVARPLVMGIVNVTPDSFSDGGRHADVEAAVAHGLQLVADGADLLDVGGESTRPFSTPVDADEEWRRVGEVVRRLAHVAGVPVSIDTSKAVVAARAVAAGAEIINDVTGLTGDPDMVRVAAESGVGVCAMHMQGTPQTMQQAPHYDNVVQEVVTYLRDRVAAAVKAGIRPEAIMVDPGIGFGKTFEHNLAVLSALDQIVASVDVPVVIGTSRKGFLGAILGGAPADQRDAATLATTVHAFQAGASVVRVHDVAASVSAARVLDAIASSTHSRGVLT